MIKFHQTPSRGNNLWLLRVRKVSPNCTWQSPHVANSAGGSFRCSDPGSSEMLWPLSSVIWLLSLNSDTGPGGDWMGWLSWGCFFRRRNKHQASPIKMTTPAIPPTTPPAIAPVLEREVSVSALFEEVGVAIFVPGVDGERVVAVAVSMKWCVRLREKTTMRYITVLEYESLTINRGKAYPSL